MKLRADLTDLDDGTQHRVPASSEDFDRVSDL
jgi:hypothetical protein